MPLESGELDSPAHGGERPDRPNLSGTRYGPTTEGGEDRKRFHALRGPSVPGATSHPSNEHHQPRFADRHIGPDADAVATMLGG